MEEEVDDGSSGVSMCVLCIIKVEDGNDQGDGEWG